MKVALGITTYVKPLAIERMLEAVPEKLDNLGAVCVADDKPHDQEELVNRVSEEWKIKGYDYSLTYLTGEKNLGIAKNKNRCIKWFLESPDAKSSDILLLLDDDLALKKSTYRYAKASTLTELLVKAHTEANEPHITGYISWYRDPLTGSPFFEQFPPVMENEYLVYCKGSQGIMLSTTREAVEKVGYMNPDFGQYGHEHIEWSARISRLYGKSPALVPILKNCSRYFCCAGIQNGYEVDPQDLQRNSRLFQKRMDEISKGIVLKINRWE